VAELAGEIDRAADQPGHRAECDVRREAAKRVYDREPRRPGAGEADQRPAHRDAVDAAEQARHEDHDHRATTVTSATNFAVPGSTETVRSCQPTRVMIGARYAAPSAARSSAIA